MKKLILTLLVVAAGMAVEVNAQEPTRREIRREEREATRAGRQVAFERFVDSLVMSQSFRFLPRSFQMMPAGRRRQISNPNFRVQLFPSFVDVHMPFYYGRTPPFVISVINRSIPSPRGMLFEQREGGWEVSFESHMFTSGNHRFRFSIDSVTGDCRLTVDSPFHNRVVYSGIITGMN